MYKGNKFKNSVGAHLLKALFFEEATDTERPDCLYTLKQDDHTEPKVQDGVPPKVYLSLHKLYVSSLSVSEHEFALRYFDNYAHWKKLCACNWFKPYLQDMREELDVKQRGAALKAIQDTANDDTSKSHFMANKYIVENGLQIKHDTRGRPSKEKIKAEAEKLFLTAEEATEDFNRIRSFIN